MFQCTNIAVKLPLKDFFFFFFLAFEKNLTVSFYNGIANKFQINNGFSRQCFSHSFQIHAAT